MIDNKKLIAVLINSLSSGVFISNNASKNNPYKRQTLNFIFSEATFSSLI